MCHAAMSATTILVVVLSIDAADSNRRDLIVSIDFPGGSGQVASIDQQTRTMVLNPTPHPGRGWECWWFVRVEGITPGETIALDVGGFGNWATPDRAAFSTDRRAWQQTAPGTRVNKRIIYRQKVDADRAWFAWGPPYVPGDALRLIETAVQGSPSASRFVLGRTREKRDVLGVRIADPAQAGKQPAVWIQARQHAWECGSSWVAQGLVEWLVSDDPRAAALRSKAEFTIIPIMDVDNVTIGAGGKEEKPHDHNRDWSDDPVFPDVAAAMNELRRLNNEQRLKLFVDIHNPDAGRRESYFYLCSNSFLNGAARSELDRFLADCRSEMTGPLPFRGHTEVSGEGYHPLWDRICINWLRKHSPDRVVAATLEVPWNSPASNTDGYRRTGAELGKGIERFLSSKRATH